MLNLAGAKAVSARGGRNDTIVKTSMNSLIDSQLAHATSAFGGAATLKADRGKKEGCVNLSLGTSLQIWEVPRIPKQTSFVCYPS